MSNKFINGLGLILSDRAEKNIQSNLLMEFYDQLDQDDQFYADRKWAGMSDIPEVMEAFNKFYDLKEGDPEYLD
jgi:hypothetical protein